MPATVVVIVTKAVIMILPFIKALATYGYIVSHLVLATFSSR